MSRDMIRMGGIVGVTLIIAITALTIFHPGDNTATISAMVAAALALFSALSSRTNAAKIEDNSTRTDQVHEIVNDQRLQMEKRIRDLESIAEELRTERAVTAGVQEQKDRDREGRPGASS